MAIKYREKEPSARDVEIERITKRLADVKLSNRMRTNLAAELSRIQTLTEAQFDDDVKKALASPAKASRQPVDEPSDL